MGEKLNSAVLYSMARQVSLRSSLCFPDKWCWIANTPSNHGGTDTSQHRETDVLTRARKGRFTQPISAILLRAVVIPGLAARVFIQRATRAAHARYNLGDD